MKETVPEHIAHNLDILQENIIHYNPVAARVIQLAETLDFGEWPARSRGHLAIPGGLVIHSVETAMLMMKLHRAVDPGFRKIPPYSVMLVGLFHDLGKCGVEKYPYFEVGARGEGSWKISHMGKKEGHAAFGLSLFERAGVELSKAEYVAIAKHGYNKKDPAGRGEPLARLLCFANLWANGLHEVAKP